MKNKLSLLCCLSVLLLGACNDNEYTGENSPVGGKPIVLSSEIDQISVTRVNDGGFCNNDVIGVYIVDYQGSKPGKLTKNDNRANNVQFTFDEAAYRWTSPFDIYWKDQTTHIDVYGHYPYAEPSSIEAYNFEVQKDQARAATESALGGYEASDFLWAKAPDVAPTANIIRLAFRHKMASAKISLVQGTGFASGEWATLSKEALVLNTKRNAIINLAEGTVQSTGDVANTGIIPTKNGGDFRAIVVPQTVAASQPLFSLTVGGVSYKFTKNEVYTYISGKMHNFSIVINKKANTGDYEFVLAGESITAWENDPASHDATAREYVVVDVAQPGTLKKAIADAGKDHTRLLNLKITGQINEEDFTFMREEMSRLQSLNMKEVLVENNTIPNSALYGKASLLRIVLPDKLQKIEGSAFNGCANLTGSLIIPEGVTEIGNNAFFVCSNMTGTLSLPTTLEKIDHYAFYRSGFTCELILPSKLTYIGGSAFFSCSSLYGSLNLPDGLTYLGGDAFFGCSNMTGSIVIPQGVTEINDRTFWYFGGGGTLTLHDGITSIGSSAFLSSHLRGELILPKDLTVISSNAFYGCDFSGELKLPASLITIGSDAFGNNWRLMGTLEIPENVQNIGGGAFSNCRGIEKIIFPAGLDNIQDRAFANCFGIGSIVSKSAIPPYVHSSAFDGVAKDNFTLEVPESAVAQYQTAPSWKEFKRISAHRELVCRPALATAINTKCTRQLVLNAEGDWEVESMPDWCSLSQTSGTQKTELTLTIDAMPRGAAPRNEEIVFKLKNKDYTTRCAVTQYDYEHDEDKIITLQQAKKGKGINLVFLGDGFNAEDISKGEYMKAMREQVEHFFAVEPYTTYRDYFNVYTAIALSPESGIGTVNTIRYTRFETTFTGGAGLQCDSEAIFEYALKIPAVTANNLHQSLIVMTPNTNEYGGICHMWGDGSAIAICPMSTYGYPYDTRGVLQHEAGGHGFGKLGDEYIYHNAFIDYCKCICCDHASAVRTAHAQGWYQNLSLTGKMHEVPWSHLIFHEKYSNIVDIFEGGFMHSRGVFRSEQNSCMNNNIPYYSTISREAIVKRIMEYAGETYTFEMFVANDNPNAGAATRTTDAYEGKNPFGRQHGPHIHKGSPIKF